MKAIEKVLKEKELRLGDDAKIGLAGRVLREIDPHSEADEVAILINFLTYFSNNMGQNPFFMIQGDKVFAKLFSVVAGKSADGRKGSALGPINFLFRKINEEWIVNCKKTGLSSGEGLISELQSRKDKEDNRLLLVEEEFASVLKVIERTGNTLSAQLRKAWDGQGELNTLTKQALHVPNSHVCILGQITVEELNLLYKAGDIYNGLFNRFIWLYVKRSKFLPEGGSLHKQNLTTLIAEISEALEFSKNVKEIKRDDEAKKYWECLYYDLGQRENSRFGAIQTRAENQVLRLSMIYALLDKSTRIKKKHILAAEALWEYSVQSLPHIFFSSSTNVSTKAKNKLIQKLHEKERLSRTEIVRLYGGNKSQKEIDSILQQLSDENVISSHREKSEKSAKHTEYFELATRSIQTQ